MTCIIRYIQGVSPPYFLKVTVKYFGSTFQVKSLLKMIPLPLLVMDAAWCVHILFVFVCAHAFVHDLELCFENECVTSLPGGQETEHRDYAGSLRTWASLRLSNYAGTG